MSHTLLHHQHRMQRAKGKAKTNRIKRNAAMKGSRKNTLGLLQLAIWKAAVESLSNQALNILKRR